MSEEQVQGTLPAENVPSGTPGEAAPATPVSQGLDIEARLAEIERKNNERLAQLQVEQERLVHEQTERIKQSLRDRDNSILDRVNQRIEEASVGLNKAVDEGVIERETADEMRTKLRSDFEREELERYRKSNAQEKALSQIPPEQTEIAQRVQQSCLTILQQSGLEANDPEVAELPRQLSGDPFQAVLGYREAVDKLKQKKQARLGGGAKTPAQPKPFVDMANGTAPGKPPERKPKPTLDDADDLESAIRRHIYGQK